MTAPAHEQVLDAVVEPEHVVTESDRVAALEPDTPPHRGGRWKSVLLNVLPPLVVAAVVVGVWYVHHLRRARAPPAVPHAPAPGRPAGGLLRPRQPERHRPRPVVVGAGRVRGARCLDRDRHGVRRRDEPGPVGRAVVLPVGGRAADRSDPRLGPLDRVLVQVRLRQPRPRVRDHRPVPDRRRTPSSG